MTSKEILNRIYRSGLIFGVFSVIGNLIPWLLSNIRLQLPFHETWLYWAFLVLLLLLLFSLSRSMVLHDDSYRAAYETAGKKPGPSLLKNIIKNKQFWFDILLLTAYLHIFPCGNALGGIWDLWVDRSAIPWWQVELLLLFAVVPVMLTILLIAHASAIRQLFEAKQKYYQIATRDKTDYTKATGWKHFLSELLWIVGVYCIGAMLTPAILPVLYSFIRILGMKALWPVLLLLLLLPTVYRYIRALIHRFRFKRKLIKVCRSNRYELDFRRGFYRSIFLEEDGAQFTVWVGKEKYDCKLICALRRYTPLCFDGDGNAITVFTVRVFRWVELFHYVSVQNYQFESSDHKVVIMNPVPHVARLDGTKKVRAFDTGERLGEYTIHSGSGFLSSLTRGVVEHKEKLGS